MSESLLITGARIVDLATGRADAPTAMRLRGGVVDAVGNLAPADDERVLDAAGRWCIPGLWDRHVHLDESSAMPERLDLYATASEAEVLDAVAARLAAAPGPAAVIGMGYRSSGWAAVPRTASLDAVAGDRVVALISGDGHNGWLSSAAQRVLGLDPAEHHAALHEAEWFAVFERLHELDDAAAIDRRALHALEQAAARGVTGIVDMGFGAAWDRWARRPRPAARVRAAVYPVLVEEAIGRSLCTGSSLAPLVEQGPLKIITDGSLGTLTAHCCEPYLLPAGDERAAAHPCGIQSVPGAELERLLARAEASGLAVAVHAIGDAAVDIALDAFAATGARGGIEHAQLVRAGAVERLAELGIEASVQPAHLLDDAPVMDAVWADRTERAFALRWMLDAGVTLALGSDAPVAPLDPWLAIDAAVGRGTTPWHPEQAISRREALAASTDGTMVVEAGARADLVLLDDDPLLRSPEATAWATVCDGGITHLREERIR
ncbi:hypothetical protein SAMN04487783_1677 [Agrococcus baldri]|uniref:Amidohydrolase 3 domain-containing protein n=1 Tax=Agrococcus baldri TaxID=153730 RepID=A0AA94KZQ4_9MICO|nr:amidohydrolase family protein [Agrococcus baldri]SFS12137.1 hypothetical protein SAMN04487783_1677 [Agrococcus baldri]